MKQPSFQDIFFRALQREPKGSLTDLLDLESEAELSYLMEISALQDPLRFRAKQIGLRSAYLVIDEEGNFNEEAMGSLLLALEKPYCLGPNRENDPAIYFHLRSALLYLRDYPEARKWILKFSPPLCHKRAEEIIRDTLWPDPVKKLTAVPIRRAVLAVWFTWLRQTVGSCFATAPAILIQQTDPLSLLEDLYDLLTTGQLRRIVAAQQYTVPLCPTSGSSELRKPIVSLEALAFSPGLAAACEAANLVDGSSKGPQKIAQLLQTIEKPLHVEQLLNWLLLKNLDLTERDIEEEEYLKAIQMRSFSAKHGGIYFQAASPRSLKVAEFKRRLPKAMRVFCAFGECVLLQAWEYSIASLCDVKLSFARWNLSVGLGFHVDQKEGLGSFVYNWINNQFQNCHREIEEAGKEYEQKISAARILEGRVNRSFGESQMQSELANYVHAANRALEHRNFLIRRVNALSGLFSHLIQQYDLRLSEYFQEIFDPALTVSQEVIFEDSPAGFRLVYKHGRSDPALWTFIRSGEEYVDCLRDFFVLTEADIASTIDQQLFPHLISDLTTVLVQFIQEPAFLQAAIFRANHNPVYDSSYRTPWDYASGGTMQTFLQGYYSRTSAFTEKSILPHSEQELLQFLAEIHPKNPLLMHSPTHAFILQPNAALDFWQIAVQKGKNFWESQVLTEEMQEQIGQLVSEKIPSSIQNFFLHTWRSIPLAKDVFTLRSSLMQSFAKIPGATIKDLAGFVDSFLYETLPLVSSDLAIEGAKRLFRAVLPKQQGCISSSGFLQQVKREWMKTQIFFTEDVEMELVQKMRQSGFVYPEPLLFADTNWAGWYFGWIVGPNGSLQVWRLNRTATRGFPMTGWKHFFTAGSKDSWTVLANADEYKNS